MDISIDAYGENMRFFSVIFLFLYFLISLILPAFSEEMMLGRITDQGGDILTPSHMIKASLFALIAITMIIKRYYFNAVLKSLIAFLCALSLLCLVSPTATPFMSLPSFSEFGILAITATIISIIACIELSKNYILQNISATTIIHRLSYGVYTALMIATFMLCTISSAKATSFLEILWIGAILICAIGSNVKTISRNINTDIFIYCIVPILSGLLLAFGVHGNDQIIPSAVRFVGFSGAWIAAIAMSYKICKSYKKDEAPSQKDRHIYAEDTPSRHYKTDMKITLNIAEHNVQISDPLAEMIGLESAKREYDIDHFKALIHQEYHHNFLNSLYENDLYHDMPIMFHGTEKIYNLRQKSSENLNKSIFDVLPYETSQEEPQSSFQHPQTYGYMDMFFNNVKETVFDSPASREGHFVFILTDIRNLEMLFLEGTQQESKKVPEILISRLTKKIMHFEDLRVMQTGSTEIGLFFYSNNAQHDIQVARTMLDNICELPIECSFGNFFPKFITASAHMPALALKQSLKNDIVLNKLFENAQKEILSQSLHKGDILPDDIPMPEGTTILGLSSELRYAPEKNQLEPYFSPYISLETGTISGFYTRPFWLHPDHGLIDSKLLAFLSDYIGYDGVIQRMHMIMAVECFSKIIQKKTTEKAFLRFSVGPVALRGKFDIVTELSILVNKFDIPASQIHICLTDECMTNHLDWLAPILKEMKTLGFTVVLENYGGNTTKISHLTELPVNHVILNKSLIQNLQNDERKQYAVRTLLELFQNLNIKTDVNNLDNLDQIQVLKQFGVQNITGHSCGKEMSYGNISAYISQKSKSNHFA